MQLTKIFAGITAILLAGSALNAETVSFTSTQKVVSSFTDFYLGKFDTGLGTLTGVSVNVVYSTLTGSILFTNNDVTAASVDSFDSYLTVRQAALNDLGYTQVNGTRSNVVTTPNWKTTVLPGNTSQTFTISGGQNLVTNSTETIDSGYWAAYSSIGGGGNVTFQAKDIQSVATTGTSFALDSALAGANTQLTVTYTYDAGPVPVPEASTVIVQLLIVAGGVWMFVRRRRAAAVRA